MRSYALAFACLVAPACSGDSSGTTSSSETSGADSNSDEGADSDATTATDSTSATTSTSTSTGDGDSATSTGDTTTSTSAGDGDSATSTTGDGDDDGTTTGDGDGTTTGDGDGTTTGDGDGTTTGDGDGDGDGTSTVWRFIAMGDGGEGNQNQYDVASAVEMVCAATGGCEFVLYLGDNFYDTGVDSVTDQQFQDKFELPYMDLDIPFWIVMGNHDYGAISNDWSKLQWEVEYTMFSTKWTMPDKWYSFDHLNASFFAMDTTRLMWDHETNEQQTWLDGAIAGSGQPWKFGLSHHPYISNGSHGNAGNYEGIPLLPFVSGVTVKEVFDESVCGNIDVFFHGHDHNRQWLEPVCDTQFIVTGAAAKNTDFSNRDNNATAWDDDTTPGFMWIEVQSDSTVLTRFYDKDGNMDYERAITQ